MSKKRHNFFRLCSLVLAFMLTFTNMPAVAYATDGYSAEALVEDTTEASENDAITEDGVIEEEVEDPDALTEEVPGNPEEEISEDAEEGEELFDSEDIENTQEEDIDEEEMTLFATDVYMVDFYRAENDLIISVEVPKNNQRIDPNAIPEPQSAAGPFECWVEYNSDKTQVINRFTKAQLIAKTIDRDYDLYPQYAAWVYPEFEHEELTLVYGDAITNTLSDYGTGNTVTLSVGDETDPGVVSITNNVITPLKLGTTIIKATVTTPTYGIKVGEASYTLTITQKTVTVKAADVTETYDGTEKGGNGVDDITGLATGDAVTASVISGKLTNAGTQELTVSSVTIKHGEVDVTDCYEFNKQPGTLTINQRPIEVVWTGTTAASTGQILKPVASENDEVVQVTFIVTTYSEEACENQVDAIEQGSYWAIATEASGNFELTNAKTAFTVTGKEMLVSAVSPAKTYDGDPAVITITVTDGVTHEVIQNPTITYSLEEHGEYTEDAPVITDITEGDGTRVYFIVKKSTYVDKPGSVLVKISPKEPALTVEQEGWTFGTTPIPAPTHSTKESDGAITYTYYKIVEAEGQEPTETAIEGEPVHVGSYKVKASQVASGNYTAKEAMSAQFSITKAAPVEPDDAHKAKKADNFTYNGDEHDLIIAGTAPAGTYHYYAIKAGSKPATNPTNTDDFTTDVPKGTDAGNYYVYCYIEGDDDHIDGAVEYLGVVVGNKGNLTNITATISKSQWIYGEEAGVPGISDATITEGITYYYNTTDSTVDGTIWTDSDKPTNVDDYYLYAKIAATENYNAYTTATIPFTINKKAITVKWTNLEINSDGDAKKPTAYEDVEGYDVTFSVATYEDLACTTPKLAIEEGTYYAKATEPTGNYELSEDVKQFTVIGRLMHVAATPVVKTWDDQPAEIVVTATDGITDTPISVFEVTYSLEESGTYTSAQPVITNVTPVGGTTVYFKVTASTYAETKGSTTVTINGKDPNLTVSREGWTYAGTPTTPSYTSLSTATPTYTYYKIIDGIVQTQAVNPVDAGDYQIKATQAASGNYAAAEAVNTFSIAKAGSVTPTDANKADKAADFTYDGDAHNLAKLGTAPAGDYYYYAVMTDSTTKPADPAVADITLTTSPQGTEPGYYHVFCYIKGDDNHEDGSVQYLGYVWGKKRTRTGITVTLDGWTYGDEIGSPALSGTTITEGYTFYYSANDNTTGGTAWDSITKLNAGTHYVYAVIAETDYDYEYTTQAKSFVVAQKKLTYTVGNASKAYHAGSFTTPTITLSGVLAGDPEPSWTYGFHVFASSTSTTEVPSVSGLDVGTYEIRAYCTSSQATGNYYTENTSGTGGNTWGTLTVTPIAFPDGYINTYTAPTAAENLKWNGTEKVLIGSAGTISYKSPYSLYDENYAHFEYSLDYNSETGTGNWSNAAASIKATDAGTYTVYWRLVYQDSLNYLPYASGNFDVTIAKDTIVLDPEPVLASQYALHYRNTYQNLLAVAGKAFSSGSADREHECGTVYYSYDFPGGTTYDSTEALEGKLRDPNYHWFTADELTVKEVAYYHVYYYVKADANHENLYKVSSGKYGVFDLGETIMNPAVINIIANNTWVLYGDSPDNSFSFSVQPLTGYWNRADKDLLGIKYNPATGNNVGEYRVEPVSVEAEPNSAYYYDEAHYADREHHTHTSYLIGNYMIYDYIAGTLYIEPAPVTVTVADSEKDFGTLDPTVFEYASVEGLKNGESEDLITKPAKISRVSYAKHAYEDEPELEQIVRRDSAGKTIPYEGVLFAEIKDGENLIPYVDEDEDGIWTTPDYSKTKYGYKETKGTVRQGNYIVTFVAGDFTINHAVETIPEIQDLWGLHFNGRAQSLLKTVGVAHEPNSYSIWYSNTFVPDPDGYDSLSELNADIYRQGGTWNKDNIYATTVGSYGTYYYFVADKENTESSRTYYRYYDEVSGKYKYNVWTLGWTYMNPAILNVTTEDAYLLYGQSWENAFKPKLQVLSGEVVEDEGELDELFGFTYDKAQGNTIGTYAVAPQAVKAKQCTTPYYIDENRIATEIGYPTWQIGNYLILNYIPGTLTIEPAPVTVTVADAEKDLGADDPMKFVYASIEGLQYGESESVLTLPSIERVSYAKHAYEDSPVLEETVRYGADGKTIPYEGVLFAKAMKGTTPIAYFDEDEDGVWTTPDNSAQIVLEELKYKENITRGTERQGNYLVTYVAGDFTINHALKTIPEIADLWDLHFTGESQSLLKTKGKAYDEGDVIWYSQSFVPNPDGYDTLAALNAEVSAITDWVAEDINATTAGTYGTYYYFVGDEDYTEASRKYYRYYDEVSGGYKYNVWTLGWTYMNPAILNVTTKDAYLLYGQSWENAFEPKIEILSGDVVEDEGELDELFGFTYDKAQGNTIGTYAVAPNAVKAKQCTTPYYIDADRIATEIGHPTWQIKNYLIIDYIPGILTIEPAPVTVYLQDSSKTFGYGDPDFEYKIEGMQYGESDSLINVHTLYRKDKGDQPTWQYEGERVKTNLNSDEEIPQEDVLRVKRVGEKDPDEIYDFVSDTAFEGRLATPDNSAAIAVERGYKDDKEDHNITKGTELQGNYLVTWVSADFTIYYDKFTVTAPEAKTDLKYDHRIKQDLVTYGSVAYEGTAAVASDPVIWYTVVEDGETVPEIGPDYADKWFALAADGTAPDAIKRTDDATYSVYYWVEVPDGFKRTPALNTTTPIGPIEVTIGTTTATVVTNPTVVETIYDEEGKAQNLFKDDGVAYNGILYYRLGAEGTWSRTIPTGINAGSYDVYYKVIGSAVKEGDPEVEVATRYLDSEVYGPFEANIAKRARTTVVDKPILTDDITTTLYGTLETTKHQERDFYNLVKSRYPDDVVKYTVKSTTDLGCYFSGSYLFDGNRTGIITVNIAISGDQNHEDIDRDVKVIINGQNDEHYAIENGELIVDFMDDDYPAYPIAALGGKLAPAYIYTGSAIKPNIRVTNGSKVLTAGKDYSVSYSNNVKASANTKKKYATLKVTGKGDYSGTKNFEFYILKANIESAEVGNKVVEFGKKMAPTVTYMGNVLKSGTDYYGVPTTKQQVAGEVPVTIHGKGNFDDGEETVGAGEGNTFTVEVVTAQQMKAFTVTLDKSVNTKYFYNGEEKELSKTELVVLDKATKQPLDEDDYYVSYSNNVNAGTVKVVVTGVGMYKGTVKKSFRINPAKNVSIDLTEICKTNLLKVGAPYQNVGVTPELYLTAKLDDDHPVVDLILGKDYKVSYKNNRKVGLGTYKVTFIGNYKGHASITGNFKINAAKFSSGTISVSEQFVFNPKKTKATNYFAKPGKNLFVTVGGILLKTSEYEVTYSVAKNADIVAGTEITVTAKPRAKNANYVSDGSLSYTYTVVEQGNATDISKAKFKVVDKSTGKTVKAYYTGDEIEFNDIPVPVNGNTDDEYFDNINNRLRLTMTVGSTVFTSDGVGGPKISEHFDMEYVNNVRRGTAKVIITADDDDYVGTAVASFTITRSSVRETLRSFFDSLRAQ